VCVCRSYQPLSHTPLSLPPCFDSIADLRTSDKYNITSPATTWTTTRSNPHTPRELLHATAKSKPNTLAVNLCEHVPDESQTAAWPYPPPRPNNITGSIQVAFATASKHSDVQGTSSSPTSGAGYLAVSSPYFHAEWKLTTVHKHSGAQCVLPQPQ
jgi:hypothetical protein